MKVEHEHVRPVIDGGLDKVDQYPWVVSSWYDGKPLGERSISLRDIKNIGTQLKAVVADLGQLADVLSFEADEILTIRTPDQFLHVLFTVDYHGWFRDRAHGLPPGTGRDASVKARALLEGLVADKENEDREPELTRIPLVEERSPALSGYKPPRERYLGKVLTILGLLICLGGIVWLTMLGEENAGKIEEIDKVLKAKAEGRLIGLPEIPAHPDPVMREDGKE